MRGSRRFLLQRACLRRATSLQILGIIFVVYVTVLIEPVTDRVLCLCAFVSLSLFRSPTPVNYECKQPTKEQTCTGGPWVNTPIHNFMGYGNDVCINEFTPQQFGRMRCDFVLFIVDCVVLYTASIDASNCLSFSPFHIYISFFSCLFFSFLLISLPPLSFSQMFCGACLWRLCISRRSVEFSFACSCVGGSHCCRRFFRLALIFFL